MAENVSLPDMATEPSIAFENDYGQVELQGVFLWVGVLLVLAVIL
jgi:hypothetical protein